MSAGQDQEIDHQFAASKSKIALHDDPFVAWWLGHNPAGHVICASYGQDLADKLARDCRTVMSSPWYRGLFPTRLPGRHAVHDFITTSQGTRLATSVGVLAGRGADLILIGDPLKLDEAPSETRRRTYLSAVERSERNISVDNIARIATGLRIDAWKLLKDD